MKHHLRVITMNLCNENPTKKTTLINKWINVFSKMKGDVIFLQEINSYNLEKLVGELGMKLLNINNLENK